MCTVLVVDDSIEMLTTVTMILEDLGLQSICTSDPNKAIEICDQVNFDIVLCDLYMDNPKSKLCNSVMGGLDVIWNLADKHPSLPIIAMSGIVPEADLNKMKGRGVKGVLCKPFSRENLLAEINSALNNEQPVSEKKSAGI